MFEEIIAENFPNIVKKKKKSQPSPGSMENPR